MRTLHCRSAFVAPSTDVEEPKSDSMQHKGTYRAPRLVPLGTAVGLMQGRQYGNSYDGNFGGWFYRNN